MVLGDAACAVQSQEKVLFICKVRDLSTSHKA